MEIILLEDVRRLGERGQVVTVKPGFARNYLLPRGSALVASKGNRAFFDQQRKKIDARHTKQRNEAAEIALAISELDIRVAKRVGERDTLYGSVTTAEIAELLEKKGVTVNKRRIDLGGVTGLKTLGEHKVGIDLHPEVTAELIVKVVAEE